MITGITLNEEGKEIVKSILPLLPYKTRKYIKIFMRLYKLMGNNNVDVNKDKTLSLIKSLLK